MNQRALEPSALAMLKWMHGQQAKFEYFAPGIKAGLLEQAQECITAYEAHLKAEGFVVVEASHVAALAKFVMWAMNDGPWDGDDLYGGDVQDKGAELGLIIETKFDPKVHGDRIEAEPGDQWFVPADWLEAMLSAATTGENDADS